MLVALGPAALGAGGGVSALQITQLAAAQLAAAQLTANGAPGIVTAVALAPLPEGLPIAVTPFADDELSLAVKARFEAALRAAGRPVSD